jgi:hypothetical protein
MFSFYWFSLGLERQLFWFSFFSWFILSFLFLFGDSGSSCLFLDFFFFLDYSSLRVSFVRKREKGHEGDSFSCKKKRKEDEESCGEKTSLLNVWLTFCTPFPHIFPRSFLLLPQYIFFTFFLRSWKGLPSLGFQERLPWHHLATLCCLTLPSSWVNFPATSCIFCFLCSSISRCFPRSYFLLAFDFLVRQDRLAIGKKRNRHWVIHFDMSRIEYLSNSFYRVLS